MHDAYTALLPPQPPLSPQGFARLWARLAHRADELGTHFMIWWDARPLGNDERRITSNFPSGQYSIMATITKRYEIVDFDAVPGVKCACGLSHRALEDVTDFPATIHVTDIMADAKTHYHKRLTETYYFLECEPGAKMQLDDEIVPVHPGTCILIRPGVRHRAIGKMKVLIVVLPKFDPKDEWFD